MERQNVMDTPDLAMLPYSTVIWGGVGYAYGKMTDVSPWLAAQALATWAVADVLFFLIASAAKETQKELALTYAYTNVVVNSLAIFAMQRLELLNAKGTVALSCLTACIFFYRLAEATS